MSKIKVENSRLTCLIYPQISVILLQLISNWVFEKIQKIPELFRPISFIVRPFFTLCEVHSLCYVLDLNYFFHLFFYVGNLCEVNFKKNKSIDFFTHDVFIMPLNKHLKNIRNYYFNSKKSFNCVICICALCCSSYFFLSY